MIQGVTEAVQAVLDHVSTYTPLHQANIAAHVGFGLAALALGFAQFFTKKGGPVHRFIGRSFLAAFSVVILSAAIGSLLFQFRAFLVVITMLAAYNAVSGFRALRIRDKGLSAFDVAFSVLGLAAVGLFLYYIERVNFPWDRTVIYATLGSLALVASYDLLRVIFPRRVFGTSWIYEHIYKMTSAFSALSSAAFATVFPAWAPASQLGPSVVGILLILFFSVRAARAAPQS